MCTFHIIHYFFMTDHISICNKANRIHVCLSSNFTFELFTEKLKLVKKVLYSHCVFRTCIENYHIRKRAAAPKSIGIP